MQPEDVQKAADSALKWVDEQMTTGRSGGRGLDRIEPAGPQRLHEQQGAGARGADDVLGRRRHRVRGRRRQHRGHRRGDQHAPPTTARRSTPSAQELDTFNNDVRLRALKTLAEALEADSTEEGDHLFQLRACSATAPTIRSSCAPRSTPPSAPTSRSIPVDSRGLQADRARRQRAAGQPRRRRARSPVEAWRISSRSCRRSRRRCRRWRPTPAARRSPTRTTSARRSPRS